MHRQHVRHLPARPATSIPPNRMPSPPAAALADEADGLIRAFVAIDLRLDRFRARLDAFAIAQERSPDPGP